MKIFFIISFFLTTQTFAFEVVNQKISLESLSDFELCQKKSYSIDECEEALKRWVEKNPASSFETAKKVRLSMQHWVALKYFDIASKQKQKMNCKDEDLGLAIISGLDQRESDRPEIVKIAKKLGFDLCFPEVQSQILKSNELNSELFKNSCRFLMTKKLISGLKAAKCTALK